MVHKLASAIYNDVVTGLTGITSTPALSIDQLEDEVVDWAETMMLHSPLALRMIKAGLNAELDGQAGIQELAGDATMLYYLTEEAQEGKNAFLEKRKPDFKQFPKLP